MLAAAALPLALAALRYGATILEEESAGGLVISGGQVALVFQASTQTWAFPKGHIERDEQPINAAIREVFEETGLKGIELLGYLGRYQRSSLRSAEIVKSIHMFMFRSRKRALRPRRPDISKCKWVLMEEAPAILSYGEDIAFYQAARLLIAKASGREL